MTEIKLYHGTELEQHSEVVSYMHNLDFTTISKDDFFTVWNDYQDIKDNLIDYKNNKLELTRKSHCQLLVDLGNDLANYAIRKYCFIKKETNTELVNEFELMRAEIDSAFDFEL